MEKTYCIYMLTNKWQNVLYIGVTNNLISRIYEHKNKMMKGFTEKFNVDHLVYYEAYSGIEYAIAREKQLKGWSRKKKNALICKQNPEWKDLYDGLIG